MPLLTKSRTAESNGYTLVWGDSRDITIYEAAKDLVDFGNRCNREDEVPSVLAWEQTGDELISLTLDGLPWGEVWTEFCDNIPYEEDNENEYGDSA